MNQHLVLKTEWIDSHAYGNEVLSKLANFKLPGTISFQDYQTNAPETLFRQIKNKQKSTWNLNHILIYIELYISCVIKVQSSVHYLHGINLLSIISGWEQSEETQIKQSRSDTFTTYRSCKGFFPPFFVK